jgi:hypothetical protein
MPEAVDTVAIDVRDRSGRAERQVAAHQSNADGVARAQARPAFARRLG